MKTYQANVRIEAHTDQQAKEMLRSLATIAEKLSPEVLKQLADTVSNPVKLAFAKKQLGID